ncbi:GNAT family N-acetyltransferase [Bacillus sp. ISL-35]|uniref:GNAT family N-acetyltransferase n=1 Tax=Bacillus sp. ISL-35 TaxID=2819122 RepID=UPI0033353C61
MSEKMNRDLAVTILNWKYDTPYDFYNNDVSEESIEELLNEGYRAVVDEAGSLTGFYCTGPSAQVPAGRAEGVYRETAIDIGIGMAPEMTGKGYGYLFFSFVLEELECSRQNHPLRLTVANFNKRAIKLYENIGFRKESELKTLTNDFITMVKR